MTALGLALILAWQDAQMPPAADVYRFPPSAWCEQQYQFASAHYCWVEHEMRTAPEYRRSAWQVWLDDARWCLSCWEMISWARWEAGKDIGPIGPISPMNLGRPWLAKLRTLLGDDDYYAGVLPPCVPWWFFTWID